MFEYEPKSAAYAESVIAERCEIARKKLIEDCPEDWRTYVISRLAAHKRQVALQASQRGANHSKSTSPQLGRYSAPASVRGNPVVAARSLADIRSTLKPTKEVRP
ncbi:hypothetical protein [Pseudomonas sp. NPDC090201]|uniref:hypothetical protein n=1 Tax=Pseudomonas sp. NPDC090201 TaxID=3364475 RepID=UPI0037F51B4B